MGVARGQVGAASSFGGTFWHSGNGIPVSVDYFGYPGGVVPGGLSWRTWGVFTAWVGFGGVSLKTLSRTTEEASKYVKLEASQFVKFVGKAQVPPKPPDESSEILNQGMRNAFFC